MRIVFFLFLFSACGILGYLLYKEIPTETESLETQTSPIIQENSSQTPPQKKILVIGMDNIKVEEPRLESIWLVELTGNSHQVKLTPIFPLLQSNNPDYNQNLANAFLQNPRCVTGRPLLDELNASGIQWNTQICLDRIALRDIINFVDGVDLGIGVIDGTQAIRGLHIWTENVEGALSDHTRLLQDLCKRAAQIDPSEDLTPIFNLIPSRIRMDKSFVLAEWNRLQSYEEDFRCQFTGNTP